MEFHLARKFDFKMQKALEAHKSGRLRKARRLYDEVLNIEPHHPDANHNLGAIEVTEGHFEKAAPHFKIALETNPNNLQYWVSYIDTLLNVEDYDEAGFWLQKAEAKGARGEIFDHFKLRLEAAKGEINLIEKIENFFINSKKAVINNAAQGWYYSAFFNREFMIERLANANVNSKTKKKTIERNEAKITHKFYTATEIINHLNNEKSIPEKLKKLKQLIKNNDQNLISDSFNEKTNPKKASTQTFKEKGLNIAIIGAGVTGLFFANALKNNLGENVNILLFDNRSQKQHIREVYNREWLTHIPSETVQKYTADNIHELLQCFGDGGLIGLQINMLEAILKLSCKELGVYFYYSPKIELNELDHPSIDFFIDATGGRFKEVDYASYQTIKKEITLQELIGNFQYTGILPENSSPSSAQNDFKVILKQSGDFHYPFVNDANIHTPMIKITAVPEKLLKKVDDFIRPLNAENKFFLWKGAFKSEFNEGLIFINLSNKEFDLINAILNEPVTINGFFNDHSKILKSLNHDIVSFMEMLKILDHKNEIKIEKPFSYSPYINLNAEFGEFNGKPIYPIGDSYFTGNPKVGNGLWTHLGFINDLIRVITATNNTSEK